MAAMREAPSLSLGGDVGIKCQILSHQSQSGSVSKETGSGWTPLLILAGVVTTLNSSLPLGYNLGVVNTPANIVRQFCNDSIYIVYGKSVSESQLNIIWSVIVSIYLVGACVGAFIGGPMSDRFGRKGAVYINNIVGLVAAILFVSSLYAHSVEMLLLGRFIVGLAAGMTMCTVPIYLTELAPINLRGAMGALCPLGLSVGILLGQIMGLESILGRENSWNFLFAFYALLILLAGLGLPFLPESPNYLVTIKQDKEKAISELCRLRRLHPWDLESEVAAIEADYKLQQEAAAHYTMWSVLCSAEHRLPLLLVCSTMGILQLSGINALFYYSMTIFESAGLDVESSEYATIGMGGVLVLMALASVYYLNRFGRRFLILLSIFLCALFLILITAILNNITQGSSLPYFCVAFVICFIISFGIGLAPVPFLMAPELFTVGPRSAASAYGSITNWGSNFLVGMVFPSLMEAIGPFAFLPYVAALLLVGLFLWFYMPETRDKSPEETAELLKHGFYSKVPRPFCKKTDTLCT